jgi:uncharacterized membrane protein YdbT with pleckstrin-like domain
VWRTRFGRAAITRPCNVEAVMGYVTSNLVRNEQVAYQAKLHWFMFVAPLFWLGVGVALIAAGFFLTLSGGSVPAKPGQAVLERWVSDGPHKPLLIIAGLIVVAVAGVALLGRWIQSISTEFAVTNMRVIAKRGFISRTTLELLLGKVDSLSVDQTITGRVFGFGTVGVSAGTEKQLFKWIASPLQLRREVQERQVRP